MFISYLKGLRTRYRNLLSRELDKVPAVQGQDLEGDLTHKLRSVNSVRSKLVDFNKKFEDANEKLQAAISESGSKQEQSNLESEELDLINFHETVVEAISELNILYNELHDRKMHMHSQWLDMEKHWEKIAEMQTGIQIQTQQLISAQQLHLTELQETQKVTVKSPIQLPVLKLPSFNGDLTAWTEFWDSFKVTVHDNTHLSDVEKFTYLKGTLTGDALFTISGLSICNTNYPIAITLLMERYGNKQRILNAVYSEFMSLPPCNNSIFKLRNLYDRIEKCLRSLEANGEETWAHIFVSMIISKLPREAVTHLELIKGSERQWTVKELREQLKEYIMARETAERHTNFSPQPKNFSNNIRNELQLPWKAMPAINNVRSSAEALVVNQRETQISTDISNYPKGGCIFCGKNHWNDECTEYPTVYTRKQRIKGHCYICLKKNHLLKDCISDKSCYYCKQKGNHHRSLCTKRFTNRQPVNEIHPNQPTNTLSIFESDVEKSACMVASGETVLMQTATTCVKNPYSDYNKYVRLILDSGSHRSYITESLAKLLQLNISEYTEEICVSTFGSETPQIIRTPTVTLDVKLKDMTFLKITANVVPKITGTIQRSPIDLSTCSNWQYLCKDLSLADTFPVKQELSTLELLLGNDYYLDFVLPEKIQLTSGLYLLGSRLGWLLTGRTGSRYKRTDEVNMLILSYGNHRLSEDLMLSAPDLSLPHKPSIENFWNLESIGITDTPEETNNDKALDRFNKTVTEEGNRYYVTWPWRSETIDLPENKELALGRLKSLLRKTPELLKKYDTIIQEQENLGIIEKVAKLDTKGKIHYIPHHAVVTPTRATTKVRIVYDASAKSKLDNKSLNECLYTGPVILKDLCGLLLRFRMYPVGLIADIEKAFLQVGLRGDERDVTRFFWIKETEKPPTAGNIQIYRFARVPFGVVSSPFLLGATVTYHLNKIGTSTASKICQGLYVDNVITGANNHSQAISFYNEAKEIFKTASMNLREWASNSKTLINEIPNHDQTKKCEIKVLGITWNTTEDKMCILGPSTLHLNNSTTKRQVLSVISSVFDPLGMVSPITLRAKLFIQKLWSEKVDWDTKLNNDNLILWKSICDDFKHLPLISFDRFIGMPITDDTDVKLICFCDASMKADSTALYIRLSKEGETTVRLIYAKTRLAPLKTVSIPRLELLSVLIGIRCLNFVQSQLEFPVLHWLASKRPLPIFITNRLEEIKRRTDVTHHYVPTSENPADLATRGQFDIKTHTDYWLFGPMWLTAESNSWPSWSATSNDLDYELHLHMETLTSIGLSKKESPYIQPPFSMQPKNYSTLTKLLRVTSWCQRFIHNLTNMTKKRYLHVHTGPLKVSEIQKSKLNWEKFIQNKHYPDVISALKDRSYKRNNIISQLGLRLDSEGLIRCHGRLKHADLTEGSRTPKLIPPKDAFTKLLILDYHNRILHSGILHKHSLPSDKNIGYLKDVPL